jgi:serine/threonine protein kinase
MGKPMIKVGEIVDGKYHVTRLLGQGGMGMVVEAYRQDLDTHVAIKFMRSDMVAANGGTERFLREAQALGKLKSQHAVKVHDMGVHRRMPYIVMEHLEGMDMQTLVDQQGPLSPADAARHVRQACEAIAEAHSLGIYHRDLKPANLFLAKGASGRIIVKVLDFGIAKMMRPVDDKVSLKTSLTGQNIMIGTLPYMSPEQLVSAKDIDARADIWSLGVVLYELVTGDLPFQGRDAYEIQQAIRHEPCLMPAVLGSLEPIIRRCLKKNRDERYASTVDLALALRPIVNESFSPFSGAPERRPSPIPQSIVQDTMPAKPRAALRSDPGLAMAEGLVLPGDTAPATLRVPREPRLNLNKVNTFAPDSDKLETARMEKNIAAGGTLIMKPEAPEPPTLKRPPSDPPAPMATRTLISAPAPQHAQPAAVRTPIPVMMPARVETVRRGVLVVKQPLKLSRRQRVARRRSKLIIAATTAFALAFGFAWSSQEQAASAMAWMSTSIFGSVTSK